MIGKIKGTLSYVRDGKGIVDTASGVGYEIYLSPPFLAKFNVGDEIEVVTYLQVREDNLTLFGFEDHSQHSFFLMLLSVDGVGPKSAFTIISHLTATQIMQAVTKGTVDTFSSVPGVGKKTAQKILLELSHKIQHHFEMENLVVSSDDKLLFDALESLGFTSGQISKVISQVDPTHPVEERVRSAIQLLTAQK